MFSNQWNVADELAARHDVVANVVVKTNVVVADSVVALEPLWLAVFSQLQRLSVANNAPVRCDV